MFFPCVSETEEDMEDTVVIENEEENTGEEATADEQGLDGDTGNGANLTDPGVDTAQLRKDVEEEYRGKDNVIPL